MAKFKITSINDMSQAELKARLDELTLTVIKQNVQRAKGATLENPKVLREVKRNIARINQRLAQVQKKKK